MFVLGFSYGFVLAVLAYVSLTVARDTVMHKLSSAPQLNENVKGPIYKAWIDLVISMGLLLIIVLIVGFNSIL